MTDFYTRSATPRSNSDSLTVSLPTDVVEALDIDASQNVMIVIDDDDNVVLTNPEEWVDSIVTPE